MASNKIAYCSLEEAWNTSYPVMYNKNDSMLQDMPSNSNNIDETILNERSLTEVSTPIEKNNFEEYYMKLKNTLEKKDDELVVKEDNECDKFLSHFLECDNCKVKVDKILDIKPNIESFSNLITKNIDDSYLDILGLILIGIFVIFILDCFVKLGRNFRK